MKWLDSQDVTLPTALKESYVSGNVRGNWPLLKYGLGESLQRAAQKKPNHVAFIYADCDTHVSYGQLSNRVSILAKGLIEYGIVKGDVIMVSGNHGADFATLFYAIASIGGIFVMPYIYEPKHHNLKKLINKVNVKMLVMHERDDSIVKALKTINQGVVVKNGCVNQIDNVHEIASLKAVVVHKDNELLDIFTKAQTSDKQLNIVQSMVSSEDPGIIFMSTGTTGEPKAMLHRQNSLANTPYFWQLRRNQQRKPVVLAVENPFQDDVLCLFALTSAVVNFEHSDVTCVITPVNSQSPGASDVIVEAMEKYGATHADLWPYMWQDMIRYATTDGRDLSKLKGGMSGAQILGVETVDAFTTLVPEFVNQYGTTETLTITSNFIDDPVYKRRLESVGTPLPHVEIKLTDDQHNVVPIGEAGEVYVRTPNMFIEYIGESEKTRSVKDEYGWYRTGDVAQIDQNGFIYFIGRKEDNIRFKKMSDIIYPGVLEAAARKYNKVAEAQCVGIQSDNCFGDDICLCIILKPGESMTKDEMWAHCRSELIERDQPDYIFMMDTFPRVGARQKISKVKLREICQQLIVKQNHGDQKQIGEQWPEETYNGNMKT
ncbi:unnamed protein product [Owenia fusiformis]|uniref:AMP-dependent synthetase/ligase domain-containing protein n=1 Tax=Owenia fusiformis TaxID=6347 RepID=A0A8S4N081_OWEFU|nr:unnamed protein product [Owenia fusiformis]